MLRPAPCLQDASSTMSVRCRCQQYAAVQSRMTPRRFGRRPRIGEKSRRGTVVRASASETLTAPKDMASLKEALYDAVATLDRGLKATDAEARSVDAACRELQAAGEPVQLDWLAAGHQECGMDRYSGLWRLLFTSAFVRPPLPLPPPFSPIPPSFLSTGPVFQRVNARAGLLDNIVELGLPDVPLPSPLGVNAVRACLRHTFTVSEGNRVRIVYDQSFVQPIANRSAVELFGNKVEFSPVALQRLLPEELRSTSFTVAFMDAELLITRGTNGELRVFVTDEDVLVGGTDGRPAVLNTLDSVDD